MDRPLAVGLAVCLALSTVLAAAPTPVQSTQPRWSPGEPVHATVVTTTGSAAAGPPTPSDNTTARLEIPAYRVERSGVETVHLGLGGALGEANEEVRQRHERLIIEEEYERAESLSGRRAVIERALVRVDDRIAALRARERAAIDNYTAGEITARTLLDELARVDAEAGRMRATLERLDQFRREVNAPWFRSRIRDLDGRAETLQGPIRQRTMQVLTGAAEPTRVFVEVSEDDIVLAMLDEGRYVRESTFTSNRDPNAVHYLDLGEAFERAGTMYEWAFDDAPSPSIRAFETTFRIIVQHSQGQLVAYLDAGSGDVYREIQTMTVAAVPAQERLEADEGDLHVTVHRTYVGGPLEVEVRDGSGEAVDATVTVEGRPARETGPDGSLTTLEPRPSYDVTVESGGSTLNVSVENPPGGRTTNG